MQRIPSSPDTQYALVFLSGLIAGRLLDLGHFRFPFLFGSKYTRRCILLDYRGVQKISTILTLPRYSNWRSSIYVALLLPNSCGSLYIPADWRRNFVLGPLWESSVIGF